MDTTPLCPQCGKPLDVKAPKGLCPACLMQAAFPTGTEPEGKSPRFIAPTVEELAPQFPQLEILEFIGQGGMGAVYKARQKALDRIVALKILPPGIGQDASFAERFAREAKALAKLNHPGIVTIHEFGRSRREEARTQQLQTASQSLVTSAPTQELYFFLMEFVDGVNLRQLLNTSRISAREALAIVPQICDALQYAHDQGLVHRDIKPENILLDRRGHVKVADFGLAKIVGNGRADLPVSRDDEAGQQHRPTSELTDAGKVLGTPQYMAPEQKEHPTEVDHRADIYALGVVFYQMLTGELPGKRIEAPSKKVAIDVRLDEIVLRALEKKPELRYQQASILKTQVETIATTAAEIGQAESESVSRWTPPSSGWGWLVGKVFGLTFTSPLAFQLANASALGFLAFLGFVRGWRACFAFVGFFGFIGLAHIAEFWHRNSRSIVPGTNANAPVLNIKDARWKTIIWGFALMLGCIEMGTHMDSASVGWVIGAWGSVLWIGSTILALLAGDDEKRMRVACGIVVIDGIAVASAALWLARTNPFLLTPWRDTITVGCAIGIAYCFRKLYRLVTLRINRSGGSSASPTGSRGLKTRQIYALIGIVVVLLVRTFVLQPFIVRGGGVEPELPVGSHVLVWKLGQEFLPGDIVAYRHEKQIWVARVRSSTNSTISANRNGNPDEIIPTSQIVGKVVSVYWRASETLTATSTEFRWRVFEADAAWVDRLIPASKRQAGVQSTATSYLKYSGGGGSRMVANGTNSFKVTVSTAPEIESWRAEVSAETETALLADISTNTGVLAKGAQTVAPGWWPTGLPTIWTYTIPDTLLQHRHGSGGINLAFREMNGHSEIRMEGQIRHDTDANQVAGITAKILYQGPAPKERALVFLVPFFRKDDSEHYLVVIYEIGNELHLNATPQEAVFAEPSAEFK